MNKKKKVTENIMILEFLKAELDSSRFKNKIKKGLSELRVSTEIINNANLGDVNENNIRKKIFDIYRDYENKQGLFEGFPDDVDWYEADITKEELLNEVYYIDYDYWTELTHGSRLPKDAVKAIKEGKTVFGVSNEGFINTSNDLRKGKRFKKLILVSDGRKIVVLEGHLRLTVYAMNPDLVPEKMPVIIGYSNSMFEWGCF